MKCPRCNTNLSDDAAFCYKCGMDIYGGNYAQATNDGDTARRDASVKAKVAIAVLLTVIILLLAGIICFLILNKGGSDDEQVNANVNQSTEQVKDKKVEVPAVVGHEYALAQQWLEEKNLQVSYVSEYSDNVSENIVIRQTPSPGTEINEWETVSIVVSKGKYTSIDYSQYNVPSTAKTSSGFILPDSGVRYLTYSDLKNLDASTLELARNEIYARHGRKFESTRIQQYFDSKTWYIGVIEPRDFTDGYLNKYEKANIKYIQEQERYIAANGYTDINSSAGDINDKPVFTSISASSTLPTDNEASYDCTNMLYDNNTCWSEGVAGVGIGESITFSNTSVQQISGMGIKNGLCKTEGLFYKNGRVLKMRFEFSNGEIMYKDIADTRSMQYISFGKTISTTYVKMTIADACSGTKFEDTCITLLLPY